VVTNFNWSFPMFELRKPLKSLCSLHGTVTKSCFEHLTCFWCGAYEFEAKRSVIREIADFL
jgi:hypothetical protein